MLNGMDSLKIIGSQESLQESHGRRFNCNVVVYEMEQVHNYQRYPSQSIYSEQQ